MTILALDAPKLAIVRFGNDVDALVGGGKFEFLEQFKRHLLMQPYMLELAGVLRFKLEVGFDQFLEEVAFMFFCVAIPMGPSI